MPDRSDLYPYQDHAAQHIIDNPAAGLFLEMGLGKTVAALTAIDALMFDRVEIDKVLVIAPLKVAENVWGSEVEKWKHLNHLRVSLVLGSERQRKEGLKAKADIYVINRENVSWLVAHYAGAFPFDMVVIDELSSFKSAKAVRFKALRMVRPKVKRIVGLTGTPAPNGLLDLWSQLYLLDMGERLGKTLTSYRDKYFTPGKRNGHVIFEYNLRKDNEILLGQGYYEKEIYEKIGDICISMKKKDYLDLPGRVDRNVEINLPPDIQTKYNTFEREQVLALMEHELTAVNAAGLRIKLLQFANGAVYTGDKKNFIEVHDQKIRMLDEILESMNGKPILVFYSFQHDLERIKLHLKHHKPYVLKTPEDFKLWNEGKISFAVGHPASMSHGLNLQFGGHHSFWFGLPDNLEWYQQACERLDRPGQENLVINQRLIAKKTLDEAVLSSLEGKTDVQEALMNAVKALILKHTDPK
jgi:SNF2 family DNA or RNA helicase